MTSQRLTRLGAALALAGTAHAALNARLLPRAAGRDDRPVSVLIPARDEAARIGACLDALRGQGAAEILVLDDGSRDDTAAVAAARGARVLTGEPTPAGWLGKPWACAQLAAAATTDVLVFLDADVRLEPDGLARAVAWLDRADLVSPQPRQVAVSPAERLVQPLLFWSILTFLPMRLAERSRRSSLSAANGQFLVVQRDSYRRAGGHVPDEVLDDVALARAVKRSGGAVLVAGGADLARCRMYEDWAQVRDGHGKSLWSAFGPPPAAAALFGLLGLAYVVPPLAALRGSRAGLVGYLAAVAGRLIGARVGGDRGWPDALAHPMSIGLLGYCTARSHVRHRRGGLTWKGRAVGRG